MVNSCAVKNSIAHKTR